MYLNDVPLGQRGSFAIFGVAEALAAVLRQRRQQRDAGRSGDDRRRHSTALGALAIQQPARCRIAGTSCCSRWPTPGTSRRTPPSARRRSRWSSSQRALEAEAPYFVDYVDQSLDEQYPGPDDHDRPKPSTCTRRSTSTCSVSRRTRCATGSRTSTRCCRSAKRGQGRSGAHRRRSDDRRNPRLRRRPFLQPVAVQPRDRVAPAARIGVQAVRLPHGVRAGDRQRGAPTSRRPLSRSTSRRRSSSTIRCGRRRTTRRTTTAPSRTASRSRTRATSPPFTSRSPPATTTSRRCGRSLGVGNPPKPYPSIALGVFEATPFEIATAYTLFPNGGTCGRCGISSRSRAAGRTSRRHRKTTPRPIARPDTTYLVTDMMRSVLNEGTGAPARARPGFTLDAAGKTGTTNDLRDAWFVGFTPELLTVVWVGFDDNQPVGLTGAQAALPIWTRVHEARARRPRERRRSTCPTASRSWTSTPRPASSRRPRARQRSARPSSRARADPDLRAAQVTDA